MFSQDLPEFNMSDTTISLCKGILYDTGGPDNVYGMNQNITTVIEGGGPITLTFFNLFCTEPNLDFIYLYDGPSSASPLLGQYTGTTLPPVLLANSGVVTVVFTSDQNIASCGFNLRWESEAPLPVPPLISVPSDPFCGNNNLGVTFSEAIPCGWLDNAVWTVTANGADQPVQNVIPTCVNNLTSTLVLSMAEDFSFNCNFDVACLIQIPDECGELHEFTLNTSFLFNACGVTATLTADDNSVCAGNPVVLTASVEGCLTYTYLWNNGVPVGAGPHTVFPTIATTYTVSVTEVETGNTTTQSIAVSVSGDFILTPPQTVCQSVADITMQANTSGTWSGDGIELQTNIFDPDSAFGGINYVYFESQGCVDSVAITVTAIQTEYVTAACPGSQTFQLLATPTGGTWAGSFSTSSGIFNPSLAGTYFIIYSLNGCTDSLTVNVANIGAAINIDTICQSVDSEILMATPIGGTWSGPGVTDGDLGIFEPSQAPAGNSTITYTIHGCQEDFVVNVKAIDIGGNYHTTCPQEPPLVWYTGAAPEPPGGTWFSEIPGAVNSITGYFDPSVVPNNSYTYIIYAAPNGCVDTTFIYNLQTEVNNDTLFFCLTDPSYTLDEGELGANPGGGNWSGSGVLNQGNGTYVFSPAAAGIGSHQVTYSRNNCTDSFFIKVFPGGLPTSTLTFCGNEDPLILEPGLQSGGTWSGGGIINAQTGLFDPSSAGTGLIYVNWVSPAGCADSISISIEGFEQAQITNLETTYCFVDVDFTFEVSPPGGLLTGTNPNLIFNPSQIGAGAYQVVYKYQGVLCNSSDTVNVVVYPQLLSTITVSDDTVCEGSSTTIVANTAGGAPNLNYSYQWSNGGFPVNTNNSVPPQSGMIYVLTTDGCSDPDLDSAFIVVIPPPDFEVVTNDSVCFGEDGFGTAEVLSIGDYSIEWDGNPGATLNAPAGTNHQVVITNNDFGCQVDSTVTFPSYSPVIAAFSITPNVSCIPLDDAGNVSFIDLSQSAVSGSWDFGNGVTSPYVQGDSPSQAYPGTGSYQVELVVTNEGGCADTLIKSVCILPKDPIFIPDAFSPNDDGKNDTLYVRARGISNMEFHLYSRWGEEVFTTKSPRIGWDGQLRGKPSPSGSYFYTFRSKLENGEEYKKTGEILLIR
jgi:gliding motility-associated-like protein